MLTKVQYENDADRNQKIINNQDKILVEEQNLFEGNFLIFSDIKPLEYQLKEQLDNQLTLMDAIATLYEDMMAKGTV